MTRWLAAFLLAAPPLAGAQQLLDFRDDLAFRPDTVETLAERVYRERLGALKADGKLDSNRILLERIRRTVARLRPAVEYERSTAATISWEVHLCRQCDENASAMAGGKLLIGEEFILTLALSDEELAYLLAHEMAHVLGEHTREFATYARYFVSNGLAREYEDLQQELDESIGLQVRMAFLSAQQELEADYMGFIFGARAGVEPGAMLSLLRKLRSDSVSLPVSHPSDERRSQQAQAMFETARRIWARWTPVP